MTIFYKLNPATLTAELWAENDPKNKISVKGRWQSYAGDRASKNNTRIIFDKLPAFCEPQKTITLDPKITESSFTPKLNTKTNTGSSRVASIEYLQIAKFSEYLENEKDKQVFNTLLEKAKQVFAKKQAEAHKQGVQNHIQGLEKLGLTKEALIQLLQEQLKTTEKEKKTAENKTASTKNASKTASKKANNKRGKNE